MQSCLSPSGLGSTLAWPALVHSNLLTQDSQQRLPHLLGGFCQLPIPFPCSSTGTSSTSAGAAGQALQGLVAAALSSRR